MGYCVEDSGCLYLFEKLNTRPSYIMGGWVNDIILCLDNGLGVVYYDPGCPDFLLGN